MSSLLDRLNETMVKLSSAHFGNYKRTYDEAFHEIQIVIDNFASSNNSLQTGFKDANDGYKNYKSRCSLLLGVTRGLIHLIQYTQSERKFQIFVSSTFKDLVEYRSKAISEIRYLGHFPVGMENFYSSGKRPWDYITEVIDTSDIYVLIIGGRYGSLTSDNISFTEKEYLYAKNKKIPILTFIYNGIETLPETDCDKFGEKLNLFKCMVENENTVNYFSNESEFKSKLIGSLASEIKSNHLKGWVRY